ncbi:hypothetical protein ARMSODRAFT_1032803 [Armillaria solidipes]|uniref:Uncharacterized protein n=1 Tax=Armillaria solidipes TaxID=1076256 RepID=A0A2H3AMZ3_9AGAR|nr:hypothetical protein ARMSODRAFT_1032803 [Armillaria solidipes]
MFPCSSFSFSSLLYVLAYSVYQASMPSTDVSRRWEAPVPAVVFDYRVDGNTNEDLDLAECNTITPGIISGLLEPIVLVHTNMDSLTRLSDDVAITVDDIPSQGIIGQLLEPAVIETVSAVAVVQVTSAATTPVDDTLRSVSVPLQPTRLSLRVARAQSNLRMFKSLVLSAFVVVVVASVVMVFKQASRSSYHRFFQSIPIPASRPWRSSVLGSSAQVSVFTMIIMVLISFAMGFLARSVSFEKLFAVLDTLYPVFVDLCSCFGTMASCVIESAVSDIVEGRLGDRIRQGKVVMEDIPSSEHGGNLEASVDTASLPSGSVCNDAVQPSRTSVSIQAMPEVHEVKDVSIGTEPVSRTSVGVQCELAPEELKNVFAPGQSRDSLYATAAEGNSQSQTMADPEVFSVPRVTSIYNLYTMAPTISFPSVEDLARTTEFERLRREVRVLGETDSMNSPSLSATALGIPCPSPSTSTSTPAPPTRVQRNGGFEYFDPDFGADARHLWAREFWYLFLRNSELIKTVYDSLLPLQWAENATDEDKSKMEVRSYARRLSEHATNPILRLPGNVLPEDYDDDNESSVVSAEDQPTIETSVSSRSPSPFVRPSNPQSRLFDSSCEGSVAAPITREAFPSPSRRRPALAQVTNTPCALKHVPSRTPMKVGRVQRGQNGVPTPPPSLRPKLAKGASRFPLVAPTTRFKDESDSPTRPARRSSLQVPSMERLNRYFSKRTEMTRMSVTHTTYYVAALGPKGRSAVHRGRRALVHAAGHRGRTGSLTSLPVLPLSLVDEERWRRWWSTGHHRSPMDLGGTVDCRRVVDVFSSPIPFPFARTTDYDILRHPLHLLRLLGFRFRPGHHRYLVHGSDIRAA